MSSSSSGLLHARRSAPPPLAANAAWNIAGQVVPLIAGIAVLPLLIRVLGLDRYGFLTLVWVLVGYASIFDFGLGRVLIRVVALRAARGDDAGAHHAGRVGMLFLAAFGVAIGAAFAMGSGWLMAHVFKVPPALNAEALHSMWLLGASIPVVMLTTGYTAVLSGHQQFRGLNVLRAALGVAGYVGPLAVALIMNRLDAIVAFIVLMRGLALVVYAILAWRGCGFRFYALLPDRTTTRELFSLGGWVGISNIVSPMLTYLDRLILGALVPVRAVAFYATPFDLSSKALILPYALVGALFPAVAGVVPASDAAMQRLTQSVRLLLILIFPLIFGLVVFARPGLDLWLGSEFSHESALVLQLLACGVLVNGLAQGPAMLIQAAGQPRLMALLHLVELPLFICVLVGLTMRFGILGTAAATVLRSTVDAIAVYLLARHDVASGPLNWHPAIMPAVVCASLLAAGFWPSTIGEASCVFFGGIGMLAAYGWKGMLMESERRRLLDVFKKAQIPNGSPTL